MKISFKMFRVNTLDGIVAQFTDVLSNLDLLIASKLEQAAGHQDVITKATADRNAAHEEALKAKSIRANIAALIEEKNG